MTHADMFQVFRTCHSFVKTPFVSEMNERTEEKNEGVKIAKQNPWISQRDRQCGEFSFFCS